MSSTEIGRFLFQSRIEIKTNFEIDNTIKFMAFAKLEIPVKYGKVRCFCFFFIISRRSLRV